MSEKKETKLKEQFINNFHKAFINRVKEAVEKKESNYIISLLSELITRLNNLIPRRIDLHESLKSQIDLVLIKQMIDNNAFSSTDFYYIIDGFIERIEILQAPIDSYLLEEFKIFINSLQDYSWGEALGKCILEMNKIIDTVEKRIKESLKNPIVQEYLRLKLEKNN